MLTGIGTVLRDDPELTVRHVSCKRQPRRVVIDSRLDLPLDAKILMGEPPIVLTVSGDAARRAALEAKGAEVVVVPRQGEKTDLDAIARLLGDRAFNEVTVETGGKLMGSLLRAGVVDELVLYTAPLILGDTAQSLFVLPEIASLDAARPAAHRRRSHDRAGRAHHRAFLAMFTGIVVAVGPHRRRPGRRAGGCACVSRRRTSGWTTSRSATRSRSRAFATR
jgi:riboflavin-specific deaminase-like protein